MQPQDVTRVLSDPLAQELMRSSIPARLAYIGPDGSPRAIPSGERRLLLRRRVREVGDAGGGGA
jgi:hypothetical protein